MKISTLILGIALISVQVVAQKNNDAEKKQIMSDLDKKYDKYSALAQTIWGYAELAFLESKSSILLQTQLKEAGFQIEAGVADMPTAFVATYGSGKPVIGILAEFDALPGIAQEAVPEKKSIQGQAAGHACGHHLFGVASMATAIEVKDWLKRSGKSGTIKLYGTPAEEAGSGKIYMVRAGLFNDVDAVLHWHPGDRNAVTASSSLANVTAKFRFYGVASHAAASPEKGRSALDGIEAMDMMVNMMREHIPSDSRIHYVITKGGEAIVPPTPLQDNSLSIRVMLNDGRSIKFYPDEYRVYKIDDLYSIEGRGIQTNDTMRAEMPFKGTIGSPEIRSIELIESTALSRVLFPVVIGGIALGIAFIIAVANADFH